MNSFVLKRFSLLLLLCGFLFFFGNNLVSLTDPDEVFYSLTAREMVNHNDWLTPYIFDQPQFEKPILTYWFIKTAFNIFGETPFAARFFPAVFATFGVLAVYALGLLCFMNERKAFWAALILATSAFYLAMGKTVFTDMIFTVFILYSLLSFYFAYSNPFYKKVGIIAFYIFAALAVLTKGPLGFLIPAGTIFLFLLYRKQLSFLYSPWTILGFLLGMLIALPWYLFMYQQYGQVFIHEFFYNDHWRRLMMAEHKGNDHWYFYPITMMAGVFPWSLLLGAAFVDLYKRLKSSAKPFEYFLLSWMLIVLFAFGFAHSKLASYILPMFPALALLIANYVDEKLETYQYGIIRRLSYVVIGFLTILGIGLIPAYKFYQVYIPTIMPVYWLSAGLLSISGISFTLLFIDKTRQALILLSFSLMPILLTAFMITSNLEPYVSMQEVSLYLPSVQMMKSTILCIKPYTRGVRYYTHQEVALLNLGGENYFSPHPIPVITSQEQLLAFLKSQPQTFAVVKKSGYEMFNKSYNKNFQVHVLKITGPNYVLRIEPIKIS